MRRLLGIFVVLVVLRRLLGIFVVLVALTGCGESGVLDFFESGFADGEDDDDEDDGDEGDNGDNGDNGDLTEAALAGEWDIDRDTSTTVLIGTWRVVTPVDDTFLAVVSLPNPETVTQLEISETTLVFSDNTGATLKEFDFEIVTANEIRLISETPIHTIRASLSDSERLTLTDNDGTNERRAVFEIDEDETLVITEYTLNITSNEFTSRITRSDGNSETPEPIITGTFTIAGNSTIQLTEGSNATINVEATLSNDNNTLTLEFPDDDLYHRGKAVFKQ